MKRNSWLNRVKAINLLFVVVFLAGLSSCFTGKRVTYFKDVPDSLNVPLTASHQGFVEPVIQNNDILQVLIQTIDPKTAEMYAQSGKAPVESTGTTGLSGTGYQVDRDGNIELPIVGKIHVAGKSIYETKEMVREKASKYYVDPAVNIRFMNFYVTVLGDVVKPGRYNVVNEKVNVLDAIAMAGDLSITGRRDNIMLVREEDGKKLFARYNLNSSNVLMSPYYYLHSGDIIYVEPNKVKSKSATVDYTQDRYLTYTTSLISLFIALYSFFRVN